MTQVVLSVFIFTVAGNIVLFLYLNLNIFSFVNVILYLLVIAQLYLEFVGVFFISNFTEGENPNLVQFLGRKSSSSIVVVGKSYQTYCCIGFGASICILGENDMRFYQMKAGENKKVVLGFSGFLCIPHFHLNFCQFTPSQGWERKNVKTFSYSNLPCITIFGFRQNSLFRM